MYSKGDEKYGKGLFRRFETSCNRKHKAKKTPLEIAYELSVSKTFVYDMIKLHNETNSVAPKKGKPGRKPLFDESILNQIKTTVEKKTGHNIGRD